MSFRWPLRPHQKPLATLALLAPLCLCSCATLNAVNPWHHDKPPSEQAAEQFPEQPVSLEDNTEAGKYGFQTEDKTVEEEILIRRFNLDKDNLDHAINNTKELIAQSYGRPFLPELYIRLAELYAEKSRSVFFLRRLEMGERGKTHGVSSVEATGLKEKAIETYMQIVSHFPDYDELDRVHFYLAHELRELGKYEEMVTEYQTLLDNFPNSQFIPESLLLLGDYAFEQQNIDEALGYYHRVLNYPKSSAIIIARYKLAWVHVNKRNFKEALHLFEQSVTQSNASTLDVDTYNRVDIRLEALADMAYSYSQVYPDTKPGEASRYFQRFAWSRQSYTLVMEKLAKRYIIKHQWDNAAHIYRELAEIQFDGEKLLEYTENLFQCVLESKNFNHADHDVALIVKALEQIRYSAHIDEETKQKILSDYEVYARDIATRLHEKAKRSNEHGDFEIAIAAYEDFLDFFDESPNLAQMQYNYAEALYAAGDFTKAGKYYELIANNTADPKQKHDPLYSAAVSYYTALDDRDTLNYFEIAYAQDGLRDVGQAYVSLYPNSAKVEDLLFNIARVRYDEGDFSGAVTEFTAYVNRFPHSKNTKAAVELMMDALHLTEDYQGLVDLQQQLAKVPQLDGSVKQDLAKISKAAQAKIVQEMVVDSINDWDSGKEKLLSFAETTETAGMDSQALNALFVSSEEHGDIETMHVAGQAIVKRFPQSGDAENALKALIDLSLSTAQFRALADYLEQYAQQFPKNINAKHFLHQAAQLRSNLYQPELAIKDYEQLLTRFNPDDEQRKEAALALVTLQRDKHQYAQALNTAQRNKAALGSGISNALSAEFALKARNLGASQGYFKKARSQFNAKRLAPVYGENLGEVSYSFAMMSFDRYMNLQMAGSIDNAIVENKTALYEQLQKALLDTLDFKSPRWSIYACHRLYDINSEYAHFLEGAPVPGDLSADEVQQYRALIAEKAIEYKNEAYQYQQTAKQLTQKIKPFDRQLANYEQSGTSAPHPERSLITPSAQQQISLEALKTPQFRSLYDEIYKNPSDTQLQLRLAQLYRQQGDISQASVVIKNILSGDFKLSRAEKSQAYAMLGSNDIYFGEDRTARESLQKALDIDKSNYSASVNLAGLFWHYGYADYANGVYSSRVGLKDANAQMLIHARAEGFFNGAN